MFTGIVEEVGQVLSTDAVLKEESLTVWARDVLDGTRLGDSMAVNGACLTVTDLSADSFSVGIMPETLRRTNLGSLTSGDAVNLERSLQLQSRLGGHMVQGHVDGVGQVASVTAEDSSLLLRIETGAEILRYIVEKGFVAVDGASLTVTGVNDSGFQVGLVPYSLQNLAPALQQVGHKVNLEVDIVAKYVERLLIH